MSVTATAVVNNVESMKNGTSNGTAPRIEDELKNFDAVFSQIVSDLCDDTSPETSQIKSALDWYRQVLLYNVPYGKKNRGITVVHSYKLLTTSSDESGDEEMILKVRILGWCVEILQAYFLVADDIMDQSETRRGQACWYKKDGVGLMAVNDALYLENCIYTLLYKYLRDHPAYPQIMHLFHQTSSNTIIGQTLDMLSTTSEEKVDITKFTEDRYAAIAKYKTAYYSFFMPVALAMYMAGICSDEQIASARDILLFMGHYFQVQDDYLDCYGDVSLTGKIGTDIEEAKCSWLIVQAVKLANDKQRKILQECYGSASTESVLSVKTVYNDVDIPSVYHKYEEKCYSQLMEQISRACSEVGLPKLMFIQLANKIYKRQK